MYIGGNIYYFRTQIATRKSPILGFKVTNASVPDMKSSSKWKFIQRTDVSAAMF